MKPGKIIVTGASSGIGAALASFLAETGYNVVAVARDEKSLQALQKKHPAKMEIVPADITTQKGIEAVKAALKADDRPIYLIHNAGIAQPCLLEAITPSILKQHYELNVLAPALLTKALLPHLKEGGRVLHMSTSLAHNPGAGMAAYGTSKAALYALYKFSNLEYKKDGIVFASVQPGVVDTPIQQNLRSAPPEVLPMHDFFKTIHGNNELLAPATVAKFISWVLFNTTDEKFSAKEWDIYDVSHHSKWAKSGEVKPRSARGDELKKQLPIEAYTRNNFLARQNTDANAIVQAAVVADYIRPTSRL